MNDLSKQHCQMYLSQHQGKLME